MGIDKKIHRRSVLLSARRNIHDIDESNNYQLADALAKTKIDLSNVHKEKMLYVSENLKYMELVTQLKADNKRLNQALSEKETKLMKLQTQLKSHKNNIDNLSTSFEDVSILVDDIIASNPTVIDSPSSLNSNSFDSGLNSSSLNSSKTGSNPSPPTLPAALLTDKLLKEKPGPSPPLLPKAVDPFPKAVARLPHPGFSLNLPVKVSVSEPIIKGKKTVCKSANLKKSNLKTPRTCGTKPQKRKLGGDYDKAEATPRYCKRETPSRRAKSVVKSLAEPALGSKLRQGDPHTDGFFMKT